MTINEIQDQIIAEFQTFNEWMDKYSYIIELGNNLPLIDEAEKIDANLIKGCQSKVWLTANWDAEGKKIIFKADSDAIIVKGLINLLIRVLSNQTPNDILNANLYFIDKIGLREHLSPTRANGLSAMIRRMKNYAIAFKTTLTKRE